LTFDASFEAQTMHLLLGLDAFRSRRDSETHPKACDSPHDRQASFVYQHIPHKRLIYFDLVEGEAAKIREWG
jgi:hypothetical protein